MKRLIERLVLVLIVVYQKVISPLIPARCRYYPTCSCYGRQAIDLWGIAGIWLLIKRILRCHPWGGSGVDFVPLPLSKMRFCKNKTMVSCVMVDSISYKARRNYLMRRY